MAKSLHSMCTASGRKYVTKQNRNTIAMEEVNELRDERNEQTYLSTDWKFICPAAIYFIIMKSYDFSEGSVSWEG